MKNVFKILFAAFALSYVSCSGGDEEDNSKYLTFELGSKNGILIPAPAVTSSCEQLSKGDSGTGAITGAYFSLGSPTFRWTLVENPVLSEVRIVAVKLSLKSPKIGGEYTCTFSDTSLGATYYKVSRADGVVLTTIWDGLLGKAGTTTLTDTKELITSNGYTGCSLKCGGISIPVGAERFSISGIWEVFGVQKKYNSEGSTEYKELPLKIQGDFTVENVLN